MNATAKPRPDFSSTPDVEAVYDWLKANDVDEWIPENPTIYVEDGVIVYTAFTWDGPRGWDGEHLHGDATGQVPTEWRRVPMVVAPTVRVAKILTDNHGRGRRR